MRRPRITRVYGSRFWRVDFEGGFKSAAVVDDFGNLVLVTLRAAA